MKMLIVVVAVVIGCSHSTPNGQQDARAVSSDTSSVDVGIDAPADAPNARYLCGRMPPANAPMPTPPNGTAVCPALIGGINSITSGGHDRQFILVLPAHVTEGERLPVLFMWHWIGGDANAFLVRGEVQAAADEQHFIAVIPESRGANVFGTSFNTKWPFDITQSPDRMTEEFQFFDDMLACVEAQYTVNQSCVSSIGVSAGALFNDQLAQARSHQLASFVSLSGGVSATIIKPWVGAARKLPALVLYGGDGPPAQDGVRDILGCLGIGMDFSVASNALETALAHDGHFMIECKHNCGHVEPPLESPMGESKYAAMWEFALNHPYWLPEGQSPYSMIGLPPAMPAWCGIGMHSATPRMGAGCPMPENPCTN
ncbi:MAG: uncharacterized protein JWO36_4427 [Myxococcales bacterium]|nr:uncharacterized protein [Myxococcales bacterium]